MLLWCLQAIVFWRGMDSIRRFIDWSGPAVYLVMFALAAWLVWQAGWSNISFTLSDIQLSPSEQLWQMVIAAAIVAGYFAGPTLNFGDFTRYARTFDDVKRGNFWGLPVNFLVFSATTVMMVSATLPVFGEMIDDPIETVSRLDNTFVAVLGAATFVTTTIGMSYAIITKKRSTGKTTCLRPSLMFAIPRPVRALVIALNARPPRSKLLKLVSLLKWLKPSWTKVSPLFVAQI